MNKTLVILSASIFFITISIPSNAQLMDDNSVNILPFWKTNDKFYLKVTSTSKELAQGKTDTYLTNFDVILNVTEVSEKGIKIEWTYTNSELAEDDKFLENHVLANLLNKKIKVQLSDIGQFAGILNYEEIKSLSDKILDSLITSYGPNSVLTAQFRGFKQLILTKQGLEIVLLKQLKFYCFSFGYNFKLKYINNNNLKMGNPMGGQPFDAVEKVEMTKLDTINSTCTIETSKLVDTKNLKTSIIEFIKKNNPDNYQKSLDEQLKNETLEFSEKTMQLIDFNRGVPLKSKIERTMKLGFQNRVTTIEIETLK